MCVRGYALYSSLQDYTCSSTDDHRTLVDYAKLKGPPECWHLFFGNAKLQVPTKDLPHPTMNPFNLWSFSSVHVYMAVIAVKAGTNATICINKFGPRLFVELQIENDLRNDIESEFTQSFGFKFLSCYSEKYFSFDFYLAPFKLTLWLGLSITLAITCAIFQAYMFVKTGEVSFTVSLSFISLLLDDFTSVPESIANGLFYRLIFTVWGPVAVLIINCYGGLLVSELNAPLESVRPQTVEDLICKSRHLLDSRVVQNISSLAKELNFESYSAYWGNLDCSTPGFCLTPSSKIDYASNDAAAEFFQSAKESFLNDKSFPSLTKENVLEWLFINPAHNTLPTGYSPQQQNYTQTKLEALVEKDIINCKEKRAYFSVVETVSAEMDFLHISCYPSKKFYVGSASWRPRRFGWEFQKVAGSTTSSGVSVVHRNLQTLVSSGIYFRLRTANFKDLSYGRKPVANDTTPSVSKTAIDGRIMTVFMICGALTLCALVALVIEGYNEFSEILNTRKDVTANEGNVLEFPN
ncbi:hypothetical protein Fcan01_19243 [Folsomia candida]|uniref:Ionotropic glutamate receptor C-terminal domain-containing protein n=1 Tax=Folsomia candida TaxID=158441 RepID=A0A226DKD3_FOLCA|nr:hypothetical protein Fcan01_19243 [Folsomia candida]